MSYPSVNRLISWLRSRLLVSAYLNHVWFSSSLLHHQTEEPKVSKRINEPEICEDMKRWFRFNTDPGPYYGLKLLTSYLHSRGFLRCKSDPDDVAKWKSPGVCVKSPRMKSSDMHIHFSYFATDAAVLLLRLYVASIPHVVPWSHWIGMGIGKRLKLTTESKLGLQLILIFIIV